MGQTGLHVEHKHDSFIKWVNRVNPNLIRTWLASTYGIFINMLVVSGSWVVSNFATPSQSSCSFKNLALHAQSSPTFCLFYWKTFYIDSFPHFLVFGNIKKNGQRKTIFGQRKTLIKINLIFYRLFSKKYWKIISLSCSA